MSARAVARAPRAVPARRTVTDLAADALRERILEGELAEGSPIRQDAVAVALGMSRIPVREALRRLEAEGLIAIHPHCGAVVSSLSLDEITELFELRALVEADLLRRAVPELQLADLRRAGEVLDRYDRAFRDRRVDEWAELNWQFHATLLAPAGRSRSLAMVQNLHHQSERYMRMQLALTRGEARAQAEHRAILRAARAGAAGTAARLVSGHILSAGRNLTAFLRRHRSAAPARSFNSPVR